MADGLSRDGLTVRKESHGSWYVIHEKTGKPIKPPSVAYRATESREKALQFRDHLLTGNWDWNEWTPEHTPEWAEKAWALRNSYRVTAVEFYAHKETPA